MRWDEMRWEERRCRDERDYETTAYCDLLTGIKYQMIHMTPRYNVDVTIVVDDMRQHH